MKSAFFKFLVIILVIVSTVVNTNTAYATCARNTAADRAWVSLAQERVMNRVGNTASINAWANEIAKGADYHDIIKNFSNHTERLTIEVNDSYSRLLNRAPSSSERNYWINYSRSRSVAKMNAVIAGTNEYFILSGSTNDQFLRELYRDTMGREADAGGLSYWISRLSEGVTRARVAEQFIYNTESRRFIAGNLYKTILKRNATDAELTWVSAVIKNSGQLNSISQIVVTNEFWGQAQRAAGLPASSMPAKCVPQPARWIPPAGVLTSNLKGHFNTAPRLISLTFDDGPNRYTGAILDTLKSRGVKATFFVVGNNAKNNPTIIKRMAAEGHAVATHTMSHPKLISLSESGQNAEISGAANVVDGILGSGTAKCVRPPYGSYNQTTLSVAKNRGLGVVNWSRDTNDWRGYSTAQIVAAATSTQYDGGRGIVLMHDRANTPEYLNAVITALANQGYTFVNIC